MTKSNFWCRETIERLAPRIMSQEDMIALKDIEEWEREEKKNKGGEKV